MKRPLLRVALLYVTGVIAADFFPAPLPALMVASGLLAVTSCLLGRLRPFLLPVLLTAFGATNLTLHTAIISPSDLRRLIGDRIEEVTVHGTLPRTPTLKIHERGGEVSWRTTAELQVDSVRLPAGEAGWQPAFGRLTISTPGKLPPGFFGGQQIEVAGRIALPKAAIADGLFDYRDYLRRQGIYYQLQTASTN